MQKIHDIPREPVTHDKLIILFRKQKETFGTPEGNAARNKLEKVFARAIKEASEMGVLAVDMLESLGDLHDPNSGERICPTGLNKKLRLTTEQASRTEANKVRRFQALPQRQPARVEAKATKATAESEGRMPPSLSLIWAATE
ncbi:MAG TPA: hypothetical protein VMR99_00660 [Candidatus Paceibacterota bacterium]|nr:hypothetical protein [Candidatus Paceibacterota bacterium]